jgi:hypothetical protein
MLVPVVDTGTGTYSKGGIFLDLLPFMYVIQHCFMCCTTDSNVSEDAGIEPRTVATLALTARRSNHTARSQPHSATVLVLEKNVGKTLTRSES